MCIQEGGVQSPSGGFPPHPLKKFLCTPLKIIDIFEKNKVVSYFTQKQAIFVIV